MASSSITLSPNRFAHGMVVDRQAHNHVRIFSNLPQAQRYTNQLMTMSNAGGLFWPSGGVNRQSIIYAMIISIWTILGIQLNPDAVIEMISGIDYLMLIQTVSNNPVFNPNGFDLLDAGNIVPLQAALLLDLLARTIGQHVILGIVYPIARDNREHTLCLFRPPHSQDHHQVIWVYRTDPDLGSFREGFYGGFITSASQNRTTLNLQPQQWNAPTSGLQPQSHTNTFPRIPFYQMLLEVMRIWPGSDRSVRWWPSQVAHQAGEGDRTVVWHRMESAIRFYFGEDVLQRWKEEWNRHTRDALWSPAEYLERLLEFPTR